MLLKSFISLSYFLSAILFGAGCVLFGTGLGFIIRGQINESSLKFFVSGLVIFLALFFFITLTRKKLGDRLKTQGNTA
jgi:branched-subunit amino acid permease